MNVKEVLQNPIVRYVLVLLVGATIGAIFYPTKRIEEKLTKKFEEDITKLKEVHSVELKTVNDKLDTVTAQYSSYKKDSESKITTLTVQVKDLTSKQKTAYYKIIRPDGTIEIKKFTESEVTESTKVITQIQEEYKTKIEQIETKWEKIHKERVTTISKEFSQKEKEMQHRIEELEQSKVVDINPKRFGVEAGILTSKDYYGHVTVDVWGPIMLGVHGQMGNNKALGAGVGLRF